MLSPLRNFSFPRSKNPQVQNEAPTKVTELMPLAPDGVEKLMVAPDHEQRGKIADLKAILFGEQTSILENRQAPLSEKLVQQVRGPIQMTLESGLGLLGGALLGPVGLGLGALAKGGISFLRGKGDSLPKRLGSTLLTGAFAAAVGTAALVPGTLGIAATAAAGAGLAFLADKTHTPEKELPISLNVAEFAQTYLPKAQEKLGDRAELQVPDLKGLSPKKAEKLAAQAVNAATHVLCEQLSPAVAVTLAQDSAKEMFVPGGGLEEGLEAGLTSTPSMVLDSNITLSSIPTDSPAAATVHTVLLEPEFVRERSIEAVAAAVGHEQSHIDHRDSVAKMGELALNKSLTIESNQSLNPLLWEKNDRTLRNVKLAAAEISRQDEYRCDLEGAEKMLEAGATREEVEKGFTELFSLFPGDKDEFAEHPLSKDRLAAVKSHLDKIEQSKQNKLELNRIFDNFNAEQQQL